MVLVGAGHAHVQVLRKQLMRPLPDAHLTVIVDRPVAAYSGMVPGVVSGQYTRSDVEIDARPLARRAGARFIVSPVTDIDPATRTVHLTGRPPIRYDIASINVGSTVTGLDVPGVRAHAVATRPVARLLDQLDARIGQRPEHVVVVGAGAGGVELAFCALARLKRHGLSPTVTLVSSTARPLAGRAAPVGAAIQRAAAARGIQLRMNTRVVEVREDAVVLSSGETLPSGLTFWVAGAAAHAWVKGSRLPTDDRGYIVVDDDLGVRGAEGLFAVGDCAVLHSWPQIPKAGVYAVRQGPILADNLRRTLEGSKSVPYRAQRDFLTLLNLGDGEAIGARWGRALTGPLMWRLKDRIDRQFMDKFQALRPDGARAEAFSEGMPTMAEMEMVCGGCAAKVGQSPLQQALSRLPPAPAAPDVVMGAAEAEDVVAFRHAGGVVVGNLDAFTAFTDDPWLVGRVGALNAVSDLLAKGTRPRYAMAAVTVPRDAPQEETLFQVMSGIRAALDPLECHLLGGHTMLGDTLSVGLHVTGFADGPLWALGGLRPGDRLVLTRPLGSGVLWNADMSGDAAGRWMAAASDEMIRGNADAMRAARDTPVTAATDVTGFGLAGHLAEMARAAGLTIEVWLDALPAYPGALPLLGAGRRSTAHEENQKILKVMSAPGHLAADPRFALLFDPQTAGGLLLAISQDNEKLLIDSLRRAGVEGHTIAKAIDKGENTATIVVREQAPVTHE